VNSVIVSSQVRHRREVRRMSQGQLASFREAITAAQKIGDDRGYQYWAGVHGLPPPAYCQHSTPQRSAPLFLPWHRAYLYFFERQLQDRVAGVTLPWWDWTGHHDDPIPPAYARSRVDGKANPLASSPIQPGGRRNQGEKRTRREPGDISWLAGPAQVKAVLANPDFFTFQAQLESIHNGVHGYVGGTMDDIAMAAYDPIFWAHHAMIDRLWYLWQLAHPGSVLSASFLNQALPPFPMTVRQTLEITSLGYDYAAATAAVPGPTNG
jgi:tyrosinase